MMLLPGMVQGQYNNNYWVFGDSAFIDWSNSPSPIVSQGPFNYRNGSASIGDSNGLLLSSGLINNSTPLDCYIWNKYGNRIGDSIPIKGGLWYHASQFVPDPGNDSIIYLFTIGVTSVEHYGLYYSRINHKANNDSGVVIQKNLVLNTIPAFDALMAVRHGNGRDWWLITQRWYAPSAQTPTNEFRIYLISPSGVSGPFMHSIGSNHTTNGGQVVFSSNGSKFVNISARGLIELYDFDRCTGTITATTPIEQEPPGLTFVHLYQSCAFSKDDSKLYIIDLDQSISTSYIVQYDLLSSNIPQSKIIIDSMVTPQSPAQMKLAPDGKIYITAFDVSYGWPYPDTSTAYTTINNNLSVINYPDSMGVASDFQRFSFNLGTGRSYFGLPNNPDYELGAWIGSPCDTLTTNLTPNPSPEARGTWMQAWYNHEWNMIHVNAAQLKEKKGMLRLFDMEGRIVFEKPAEVISGGYYTTEINMENLASGVYVVNLMTEQDKISGKVGKY
ncbi:MAG: T9SS type A sorting domain-containing protein [Bacteroidia bacterium]|nr:T9SS type A sorting domain-containing protein [Bacteroidia bacterium]